MNQDSYSTKDIIRILGVKKGRLRQWVDNDFIKPSIAHSPGTGRKALYSRKDILLIGLFDKLLSIGIDRHTASEIVDAVKNQSIELRLPQVVKGSSLVRTSFYQDLEKTSFIIIVVLESPDTNKKFYEAANLGSDNAFLLRGNGCSRILEKLENMDNFLREALTTDSPAAATAYHIINLYDILRRVKEKTKG